MSKEKEHFERVVSVLRGNGTLNPGQAAAAVEGYDNAVAEIAEFERLKAEDERPTVPDLIIADSDLEPVTEDLTRDGEVKPRTKGKASK